MGNVGLAELIVLADLAAAALLVTAFWLALRAYRRARRLERRMNGGPSVQPIPK
jgi:hypothetical protein